MQSWLCCVGHLQVGLRVLGAVSVATAALLDSDAVEVLAVAAASQSDVAAASSIFGRHTSDFDVSIVSG